MSKQQHISEIRFPYGKREDEFLESDLVSKDPMVQFDDWFKTACDDPKTPEPNAMMLATVKENGRPAARMLLLKSYDGNGFSFFTNYRSAKGCQIEHSPFAALVFRWIHQHRSVRVEGKVEKLPPQASDEYFAKRPRPSQLAAHVSTNQSASIESRQVLLDRELVLEDVYKDKEVPRPDYWGGYVLKPDLIEFWQGHSTRMHDRIVFTKQDCPSSEHMREGENGWMYQRLEP